MLSFKPFFIHGCRNKRRNDSGALRHAPRGFTVFVTPADQERSINIQVTMCHYKDEFSRKMGRQYVVQEPVQTINTRDLPRVIEKVAHKARCGQYTYDYVLKYVV